MALVVDVKMRRRYTYCGGLTTPPALICPILQKEIRANFPARDLSRSLRGYTDPKHSHHRCIGLDVGERSAFRFCFSTEPLRVSTHVILSSALTRYCRAVYHTFSRPHVLILCGAHQHFECTTPLFFTILDGRSPCCCLCCCCNHHFDLP